jgi:hypothetical protein
MSVSVYLHVFMGPSLVVLAQVNADGDGWMSACLAPIRTRHGYGIRAAYDSMANFPPVAGYQDKLPRRRRIAFQTPGAVDLPSVDSVTRLQPIYAVFLRIW